MSTYKKFNKNWRERRQQAHNYLSKICIMKNYKSKKNLDYYFTNFINKLIKN